MDGYRVLERTVCMMFLCFIKFLGIQRTFFLYVIRSMLNFFAALRRLAYIDVVYRAATWCIWLHLFYISNYLSCLCLPCEQSLLDNFARTNKEMETLPKSCIFLFEHAWRFPGYNLVPIFICKFPNTNDINI